MEDVVLNVEVSDIDCLYRIARRSDTVTMVVYVTICDASIIPADERTESFLILKNLRKLTDWNDWNWHTMEVLKTETGIRTEIDRIPPHALSTENLLSQVPRYNIFDVELLGGVKHRVSRARIGEEDVFMKIVPFSYELNYMQQEASVYQSLLGHKLSLAPNLLGYVYEETPDRIIGILCQAIRGRHPLPADYNKCMDALKRLHANGIHHGDINRYNVLITPGDDVVFIDFENSTLIATSGWSDTEIDSRMQAEEHQLYDCLSDQSDRGRPFDMSD